MSVRANRNDNFSKSAEGVTMGQVRKGTEGTGSIQVTMRNDPSFEIRGGASRHRLRDGQFQAHPPGPRPKWCTN